MGNGSAARSSFEFDTVRLLGTDRADNLISIKHVVDSIEDESTAFDQFGILRLVTTHRAFEQLIGFPPVVDRWFILNLSAAKHYPSPWAYYAQLTETGYRLLARGSVVGGTYLVAPDDPDDGRPAGYSLGAAAVPAHRLPNEIAAACLPWQQAFDAGPLWQQLKPASSVVIHDVGQASFTSIRDQNDDVIALYDVGWPLSFNGRTVPNSTNATPSICDLVDHAPVILSHWDWDHLHMGVVDAKLRDRPWIVPRQKLGPGAARHANTLARSGNLYCQRPGRLASPVGDILIAPSSANQNDGGISMHVRLQDAETGETNQKVLMVGDSRYSLVTNALGVQNVDYLVTTHHGARLATNDLAPAPTCPERRHVVSYGKGNVYRHPHPEAERAHASVGWGRMLPTASQGGNKRGDRIVPHDV